MAWDLAFDKDVILTQNSDLAGKSGTDLIEQRMKIRLKLQRGSWAYDDNDSLGSQLHSLLGMSPDRAIHFASVYARDALREMEEIQVDDIHVTPGVGTVTLVIDYHVLEEFGAASEEAAQRVEIGITAGGSI